jgi:hypothetical protein
MNAHTADRYDSDAAFRESVNREAAKRVKADPTFWNDAHPTLLKLRAEKFVETERWTVLEEVAWRLLNSTKWRTVYDWHVHDIANAWDSDIPGERFCSRCDGIHRGPINNRCPVRKKTCSAIQRKSDAAELKDRRQGKRGRGRPLKWADDASRMRTQRHEKANSLKSEDLSRINERSPMIEGKVTDQPAVDTTNTDPTFWDALLAKAGLYEAKGFRSKRSRGVFLTDSPKGRGKLVSGGYDGLRIEVVNTAHGLSSDVRGKIQEATQSGGRRFRPEGAGPDDEDRTEKN